MTESMKIEELKNYGIPSHIVNILEKHYSPDLLPIQEEAVKGRMLYAPTEGIDSRFRGCVTTIYIWQ